jgi:hypothetical protein
MTAAARPMTTHIVLSASLVGRTVMANEST